MEIELDVLQTGALTFLLAALGAWAASNMRAFKRFSIPGPVIGGFIFSIIVLILRETHVATLTVDNTLQKPAMLAFFTTIGLGASLNLIKAGGRYLMIYLGACWTIAIAQNLIGIGLATLLGINPLLGVMAGAVALEGGHGNAAAFGPTVEELGVDGATAVAIAAATFGLLAGSLLGGPLSMWLIRRNNLAITTRKLDSEAFEERFTQEHDPTPTDLASFLTTGAFIGVMVVIGIFFGDWFTDLTGYALPSYVGAMLIAAIVRNIGDALGWFRLNPHIIAFIGELTLAFFLTQAMMSLKIWDLYSLALPLVIILTIQVVALLLFVTFIVFRVLGKDYDAAVICGGMMGHGLGGTPNAVANMDAVGRRCGLQSKIAMIVVPLSGAVLIDIVSVPWITFCINWLA